MQNKAENEEFTEAETRRRMDDAVRRALTTPHKPLTKFKGKSAATGKRKPKSKR